MVESKFMSSIFSKIIQGEIPCHKVWEDADHFAFLDIRPFALGHTLIIPKKEQDYLFDLSIAESQALWRAAHHVARLLKQRLACQRVVVMVLGYEIAHAHIHLIPTHHESDVLPPKSKVMSHDQLAKIASILREEVVLTPLDWSTADQSTADQIEQLSSNEPSKNEVPTSKQIETRWDTFAERFVTYLEPFTLRIAECGINHLQLQAHHRVLEIGCGGGAAGVHLVHRLSSLETTSTIASSESERSTSSLSQVVLSDLSQNMINLARQTLDNHGYTQVATVRANAQNLPFDENSFDRIFSCLNLMLVADPQEAMNEAHRVLTHDGLAVWIVWGRPEYSLMMTLVSQTLAEIGINLPSSTRSNFHLGGLHYIQTLLKNTGFHRIRTWYQPNIIDIETGNTFVQLMLNSKPELKDLFTSPELYLQWQDCLAKRAEEALEQGVGIGLDTMFIVARARKELSLK
jgi:histidine triad (HIT) family protein